jgi:RanBP-type and C3HC4-type zinc finger-containing protein 1
MKLTIGILIFKLLTAEAHEKHLTKSVKLAECGTANSFHCKTMNCAGWCELEGDGPHQGTFQCGICKKKNCISCGVSFNCQFSLQFRLF